MSRPLRIEYLGAWYHIMNRGLGRRRIFRSDKDHHYFLSLLADATDRFNAEWHAYCLMSNHYHLMLRTPDGKLQRIMRHINGLYTQYFNRSHKRDGPLFRGRYKAVLVDAESHWLQLSRYVHRNPAEAGLVQRLADYPWSSYCAYIELTEPPPWLTTKYLLQAAGQRQRTTRYAAFVEQRIDDEVTSFYGNARQGAILGNDRFREKVLAGYADSVDVPELRSERPAPTLAAIVAGVCRKFDVDEQAIWHKTRGRGCRNPARAVTMYLCQRIGDMTLREIAAAFDLASYASAGSTIRTVRQRMKNDAELEKAIDYILLDLTP